MVFFFTDMSSFAFGVGLNKEGNRITGNPTSEDWIEGTKLGSVRGVTS